MQLVLEFSRSGEHRGRLQKLAAETGRDPAVLSKMLRGLDVPSLATVVLVAKALGVSESRLIRFPPVWHRLMEDLAE
jgi:transcriptional regulator with XRE-family HTH domain